jgi:hypothetical protein
MKHIYVRPLEGTTAWEVVENTLWQAFCHDLFWYGPFTAIYNLMGQVFK